MLKPLAIMACLLLAACSGQKTPTSTIITNALIVDGRGAKPYKGAVRIEGEKIAAVGDVQPKAGDEVIDAKGMVLSPGFIDTHSHHEEGLFKAPEAREAISQGITTIVVGQDGFQTYGTAELREKMSKTPVAVNIATYAGHNSIRAKVMGDDYKKPATPNQIAAMSKLLDAEMDAGALGLSTGLEYDPGLYATTGEVIALAKVAAKKGGRYISHIRSEDVGFDAALEEFLAVGKATGMPIQLSHAKLAMKKRWGTAPAMLKRLDQARAEGINVTADVYPYEYWQSTLTILFPKRDFTDVAAARFALDQLAPADGLVLSSFAADPSLIGKSIAQIARERNQPPERVLMDLVQLATNTKKAESVIGTSMRWDDISTWLQWRHSNVASDGALKDIHPRGAGTFTKILREVVREKRLMTLEQAIHKMTQQSAQHMGFKNRGLIAVGHHADIIVFDPQKVRDKATINDPHLISEGIEAVWVNGALSYQSNKKLSAYNGRFLTK
jgi:N-acyl-D-amino-acid deacylase